MAIGGHPERGGKLTDHRERDPLLYWYVESFLMVSRLPELQIMLGQTNVLRVVFSPEIQRALASGQATLMQSGQFALPVAVNH